ncbi:MAG: hypothetical protein WAL35_02020 [Acidimicrobiales bacterium]
MSDPPEDRILAVTNAASCVPNLARRPVPPADTEVGGLFGA